MSVQTALQFIQLLRNDDDIKNQALALSHSEDLEQLVKLGTKVGLSFTTQDLELAHKHDWAMRWFIFSANTTKS